MGTLTTEDRFAIQDLIHRFYRLVDMGRAGETAALFTPTARITFGPGSPKPGTIEGDAIPASMAAREALASVTTRHALSNVAMSLNDDGVVDAYSLLTLYRRDGADAPMVNTIADVQENIVRFRGAWRIQERVISPVFTR